MDPKQAASEREAIQKEFDELKAEIETLVEQRKSFLSSVDSKLETAKIRMQQLQGAFQLIEKMCPSKKEEPKEEEKLVEVKPVPTKK